MARSVSLDRAARAASSVAALVSLHQRLVVGRHDGIGVLVGEQAAAHDPRDGQPPVAVEQRRAAGQLDHPLVERGVGRKPGAHRHRFERQRCLHQRAQPGEVVRAEAPDGEIGGAELDRQPGAERVLDGGERERGHDEPAVTVAVHEPFAAEPSQRAANGLRRQVELGGEGVGVEQLADRQSPIEQTLAQAGVGLGVLLELEAPELAAEVGQRRLALARARVDDLGQEHTVRAARDMLDHTALELRQRVAQQRDAVLAVGDVQPRELVRGPRGEVPRQGPLVLREDVHREVPSLLDRAPGGGLAVEADEQHRWLERQRRHRAGGGAEALSAVRDGDHSHSAGEVTDRVAERVGRDVCRGRGHQISGVMLSSYGIPRRALPYTSWLTDGITTACRPAVFESRQSRCSGLTSAKLEAPLAEITVSIAARACWIAQPVSARTRARAR